MKKATPILSLALLIFTIAFSACSKSSSEYFSDESEFYQEEPTIQQGMEEADVLYEPNSKLDRSSAGLFDNLEKEKSVNKNESWDDQSRDKNQKGQKEDQEPKRIYSGYADLIVEDVEESKKNIEIFATSIDGYVENIFETSMTIRVPAEMFDEAFNWILEQGKVRHQSVETADVSEYYSDLAGRLEIAREARDRLYELLARTKDTNEQVRILTEIGRLTEEIESIELVLQSLQNFISFSRISVDLTPRLSGEAVTKDSIPFRWMRQLSPLYPFTNRLRASVEINPGDEFAVFEKENIYRAENFDGVQIRVSSIKNNPQGDSFFWQKALMYHLEDFYRDSEAVNLSVSGTPLNGVLWVSKDREPFHYFVGVIEDGKDLHIVEIFNPVVDEALMKKLFSILEQGEIK